MALWLVFSKVTPISYLPRSRAPHVAARPSDPDTNGAAVREPVNVTDFLTADRSGTSLSRKGELFAVGTIGTGGTAMPTSLAGPATIDRSPRRMPSVLPTTDAPMRVTPSMEPHPTPRIFVVPQRTNGSATTMAQRLSEPQVLASELDELIPDLIREFDRSDNMTSPGELAILQRIRSISTRTHRQAAIDDWTASVRRIGLTERNRRAALDLFPQLDPDIA